MTMPNATLHYKRINPVIDNDSLDDASEENLQALGKRAKAYIKDNNDGLRAVIEKLKQGYGLRKASGDNVSDATN